MTIAGLTGTIGTGKSTVAAMFGKLGAFIIDADKIAHDVVEPDKPAWQSIVQTFGQAILNKDRTINRKKLADIVFNDKDKLQTLNSIVHPAVLTEISKLVEQRKAVDPEGLIVKDIPLLLELGPEAARMLAQVIIVVHCSPQVQLQRLIKRGMSESDAESRIRNQMPVEEKIKFADFVVYNDGSLEETRRQVVAIYNKLMNIEPS